ncbi:hypothetical protein LEP1GSC199_2132 [Leptospira vanthielii serovar Holland str. Waz Holland = ATCC 700522]|uniref:Uncharacterized protein n=1 Tax=Leptospira vanthielii serovar Holland str. Waz Holland = ATCC 700522 TaxID=1218591 RepID=N1WD06_9LEPT|nr:hypothetical protein LEP1GSC199_2132 [Leptospira vanthielii serovar Holland str. Waz Holland = ATCC 700522]
MKIHVDFFRESFDYDLYNRCVFEFLLKESTDLDIFVKIFNVILLGIPN